MNRLLVCFLVLASAGGFELAAQRQGGPAQGQPGGTPQRREGQAAPQGRQGGPARPARDRAQVEGTGIIRGRVLAADSGTPLRRAEVQALVGGQPPRIVLTDADGRFELRGLPAGTMTLRASKTGYVPQQFGQKSQFSAGEPIALSKGQERAIDFALMRGGAIIGRVFDDFGEPIANVRVSAFHPTFSPGGQRLVNAGAGFGLTDDTGAYRIYGLGPGSYYVSATPQAARPMAAGETVTYAATFFPGTADRTTAQRVPISAGQEQHNIDFALTMTRMVRVAGTVVDSSGQPLQAMVTLSGGSADNSSGGQRRANVSADGTFTLPGVPPGQYVLEVVGRGRSAAAPPEVAALPVSVEGSDVTGLSITTGRGASLTGTLATDNGSRLAMTGIRVNAPPAVSNRPAPARAEVTAAGTFALDGLIGAHMLRFEQLPSGWFVKSVVANGVDVSDIPLEFRGTEQVSVRVVLTDRVTQLTGSVRSDVSPRGAGIVAFADDKSKWTATSRYVRTARADENGQFTIRALPGNQRYLAVALDYLETGEHLDPEFLNRIRPLATSVSLDEGEQMRLDLSLHPRP